MQTQMKMLMKTEWKIKMQIKIKIKTKNTKQNVNDDRKTQMQMQIEIKVAEPPRIPYRMRKILIQINFYFLIKIWQMRNVSTQIRKNNFFLFFLYQFQSNNYAIFHNAIYVTPFSLSYFIRHAVC